MFTRELTEGKENYGYEIGDVEGDCGEGDQGIESSCGAKVDQGEEAADGSDENERGQWNLKGRVNLGRVIRGLEGHG